MAGEPAQLDKAMDIPKAAIAAPSRDQGRVLPIA